ncbi:MAG: hypothetical protein K6F69_00410 [Treponema sp.]|nr:hypothetical protein [Treponema sp.]
MNLKKKGLLSALAFCAASAVMAVPSNWNLYIPGANNPNDVKADVEGSGYKTFTNFSSHFSLVKNEANGKYCLKLNTLDGKNDVIMFPLSGSEKKLTVIFKAQGSEDPDKAGTPYGLLWTSLQQGSYQAILRHNASNQIKGATGSTKMKNAAGKNENIVSDWADYRLVFDIGDSGKMTASFYRNGVLRHQTKDFVKDRSEFTDDFNEEEFTGKGNYFLFGENDGGTNGFARYAYILLIKDEDVASKSLEDLSKLANFDLAQLPVTKDAGPASRRPAAKPAGINMLASEIKQDASYVDPSTINGDSLDFNALPYSKNAVQKVESDGKVLAKEIKSLKIKFAATVNPAKATNAKKKTFATIAEAIEAVEPDSYIKVMPGFYHETLNITKSGIKLIGTNPATTVIYGYEADTGGIDGNQLVKVNLLPANTDATPGAAPVKKQVENPDDATFSAMNITFYNKGAEWNKTWGSSERRSITLALYGVQKAYLKNCVFLGQQDTIYWRSGRVYAKNCYIEGEVDFLCGGATALLDNCHIYSLNYKNGGYIVAAAAADTANDKTSEYAKGWVFKNCVLDADKAMKESKKVYLGRGTWTGGSATAATSTGKTVYINCDIAEHINAKGWTDWDNVNTVSKAFFREYKNTGAGSISESKDNRQLLSDEEYNSQYSSVEKILGYKPEL